MTTTFTPLSLHFDGSSAPKIKKNNTWEINLTWKDSTGVPVDLSYYSGLMHIRKNSQADSIISLSTSNSRIFLTSSGNIKLKILAADTVTLIPGKYLYDLILTDSSILDTNGEGMGSFTLIHGEIIIEDSITRVS